MDFTPDDFNKVVQTNILGVYNGSRTAMQHFIAQRSGKLINILGHGYNRPVAWQNAYGASKAWIRSFTLALAQETKDSGVGVFAFNPGLVLTELLTDVDVIAGSEERLKAFPRWCACGLKRRRYRLKKRCGLLRRRRMEKPAS